VEIELKMMIIGATAALVFSTAAMAQKTIYTAPNGHTQGNASTLPNGQTIYAAPNSHSLGGAIATQTFAVSNGHSLGGAIATQTFTSGGGD
jgi:hypothetical protein